MISIYNYNDPVDYLNAYFNAKESLNPLFSLKSFANEIGLNSAASIIDVLRRKKKISPKLSKLIAENTNIDPSERMYFEALVSKSKAQNEENIKMYDLIMSELRPTNTDKNPTFRTSSLNIFSHWIYMAIFAMNDLKDFKLTAENIKNKLRENIEIEVIEKALFQLFEHKILIKEADGTIKSQFFRVTTHSDKAHNSARKYFEMVCDLAKDAYDVSLEKREYNSFSFSIADEDIPLAKEIIRKCRASLGNLSENKEATNVYQANLMLFPLTEEQADSD